MNQLRVRLYDVRFGDAILVSVPDNDDAGDTLTRHMLIDVGNVLASEGGQDDLFVRVLEDVKNELNGRPLDLYVMTHEHMDHVQGLFYGAKKHEPPIILPIDTAWFTASAEEDYYDRFPDAKKALTSAKRFLETIERRLANDTIDPALQALIENNNYRKTSDCVEFLRELPKQNHFVHREFDPVDAHPFKSVTFDIWAPEEDTADYYGRFRPMSFGMNAALPANAPNGQANSIPAPPAGVDLGAFYNLIASRDGGLMSNALTIDKAKNNTSLVFTMAWEGRVLLFSGDAEVRSWRTMHREGVLQPVDFIKVSHHGSHNGTPDGAILDAILPPGNPTGRTAAISTFENTYNNVPHDPTLSVLRDRCEHVVSTLDHADSFVDVFFDPVT